MHYRAIVCLLQPALLSLALGPCQGSFIPVNVGLLVAGSPLYLLPFHLYWFLRQPVPNSVSVMSGHQRLPLMLRVAPDQHGADAKPEAIEA